MNILILTTALTAAATGALAAPTARAPAPAAAAPIEFLFDPRGSYPLLTAPGRVSDIALEPGESLVATNAIAAGDTARWVIGDSSSGEGESRRVHVLVKPTDATLSTNLVINTNRRTYFLDLRASARAFVTQVSWRYPRPPSIPIVAAAPALAAPLAPARAPAVNFDYRIEGRGRLRPQTVWDDGERTYFAFESTARLRTLPPLFRVGHDSKLSELINYRVEGWTLVVDGLVDRVEFRLGRGRDARRVRIIRGAPLGGGRP
ncbi:TrbG/VirB9 family P-type conjugative transfer protein [Caulobacter sp. CCNWLY153]|uniref:TrbG/VirB9 family P-type conjugative transfer protein n=1 Tax=unclassified Caulobacter TaxID=2648921 RepID=UPI002FF2AE17